MNPTVDVEAARAAFEAAQGEVNAAQTVVANARAALQMASEALYDAEKDYDVKVVLRDAAGTVLLNAIAAKLP